MKLCPNCKAELDDHARFCLCCMTSLVEKEHIPPPMPRVHRWPLVVVLGVLSALLLTVLILWFSADPDAAAAVDIPSVPTDTSAYTYEQDGVRYTFRPATREDHPTAMILEQHFVLTRVEGVPSDGIYRVPSFVGHDTSNLVTVIADGAFDGTDAQVVDLGHNVRYVWGNAFGGCALTEIYLHEDVWIDRAAFSGCSKALTVHCPEYLENTQGVLWSELAVSYGFQWQPEIF